MALIGLEFVRDVKGRKFGGHRQIDSYFVECIRQGKKPTVTVEDAIKAQSVAAKMVRK